jgi:molecular chaperone DnaK
MGRDNRSLGKFHLDGIPPAPRGIPQVEVTFDIDSNGILTVTAKDLGTKRQQHITVTGSVRLPSEEIDRMREEAEKFKAEDEQRQKVVEAKNSGDTAAYQAERFLKDSKDKLDAKDVQAIEKAIASLRDALATEDLARIAEMQNALQQTMAGPVTKMYKDAAAAQEPEGGAQPPKGTDGEANDPAFDADYDVKP